MRPEGAQLPSVRWTEMLDAFMEADLLGPAECAAYVDRRTGQVIYPPSEGNDGDDAPDDLETSDRYVGVPHRFDLDLGSALVHDFVRRELPEVQAQVEQILPRKGGFGRFRQLLRERGAAAAWDRFEAEATKRALKEWCEDFGLQLVDDGPA